MATQAVQKYTAETVSTFLEENKTQIAAALPRHLKADRMARICLTEIRRVPKLLECDPRSLIAAVIQCSQLGLEPGVGGLVYLIPFKDQVQVIPGYQGLIDLAIRSGKVIHIWAHVVYVGDTFSQTLGTDPKIEHVPCDPSKRGAVTPEKPLANIRYFYAVARLASGQLHFEVMTLEQVLAIRDKSQGYQMSKRFGKESPWDTHFVEMGRKTAIRRICKYLPKSIELNLALELEEQLDLDGNQDLVGRTFETTATPAGEPPAAAPETPPAASPAATPVAAEIQHVRPDGAAVDADGVVLSPPWRITKDLWEGIQRQAAEAGIDRAGLTALLQEQDLPLKISDFTEAQYLHLDSLVAAARAQALAAAAEPPPEAVDFDAEAGF